MSTNKILDFSVEMQNKLDSNSHKGGWKGESMFYLINRLKQEVLELEDAYQRQDPRSITNECADVANFAMMIHDVFGDKS